LREVEAPIFSDILLTDGSKVASPMLFTPRRFLILISVTGLVDPKAIKCLEGLGKVSKSKVVPVLN
jgi:hypothetical protein